MPTKVLKDAIAARGKIQAAGAKEAAAHKDASGNIDVEAWVSATGPVLFSLAKFAKDMDEATGDPDLKVLVKDLASRRAAASRQVDLATLRIEGVTRDRAAYANLHGQAHSDASCSAKLPWRC